MISSRIALGAATLITGLTVAVTGHAEGRSHVAANTVPMIVSRALPAVVSIVTRQIEQDQFNRPVPTRGLGSGFVVDARGYILTNNHVVEGADDIKVTLTDGRTFRGALVGADPFSDLAVVKIDGTKLPVLSLGDSTKLAVGETVIAIGNPLWLEGGPTVTSGVVSALGRSMEEKDLPTLHNLIQTDAAINPGNSGGPLLNVRGQAVGINTAVIASAHGIGFAIAANTAKPILRVLMTAGRIVRPSLRVRAVSVTPQVAYANSLSLTRGALIVSVETGGPAEAAGFQPGDVVVAIDGKSVTDLHHFHDILQRHPIGVPVAVTVRRDGEILTLRPVPEAYR
jgi:S1-C subfamily serine protease